MGLKEEPLVSDGDAATCPFGSAVAIGAGCDENLLAGSSVILASIFMDMRSFDRLSHLTRLIPTAREAREA